MSLIRPTLTVLIRGFVYRENWVPLSRRRMRKRVGWDCYTQDFRENVDKHAELQEKLKQVYDVTSVISTYLSTDISVLSAVQKKLNSFVVLAPEEGSRQFTTVMTYLDLIGRELKTDYLLLLRSDIFLTDVAIEYISKHVPSEDCVSVLWDPKHFSRLVPDVLHFIPKAVIPKLYDTLKWSHGWKIPSHLHGMARWGYKIKYIVPEKYSANNIAYNAKLFKLKTEKKKRKR